MLYLKQRDFYYGAILSALISSKYRTVLVDGNSDEKRIYEFTSNIEDDFIAYFKCSMNPKESKKNRNTSWQFVFSNEEIIYIMEKVLEECNFKMFLLCGNETLKKSEIAIIEKDEIIDTIFEAKNDKKSITVRKEHCSNFYKIPRSGGRENDLSIPTNRIEKVEENMKMDTI